jgi:hypothetical protein
MEKTPKVRAYGPHPFKHPPRAALPARCQLISKFRTAAARGVLLDSGGENAYARGVCRQAIEKSPLLL